MKQKEDKQAISRKKFLYTCGSLIAGGSIVAITGMLFPNMLPAQETCSPKQAIPGEAICSSCKVSNCLLRKGVRIVEK